MDDKKEVSIYFDKCYDKDVNKGYLSFDIFNDAVQIASTSNIFLKQVYGINNITDLVNFLSDSIDTLPIYSQRRLLKAIFETYYKYVEFPKLLFVKKIYLILKKIYKLNDLDEKIILNKLEKINENSYDLYQYFLDN